MDADEIEALGPTLDAYLAEFGDCFGRVEPRGHLGTYVRGQLSGLARKSVEPIALAAGLVPRTLQWFLSGAKWLHGRMRDRLQQVVARDHADPLGRGVDRRDVAPEEGGPHARREAAALRGDGQDRQLRGDRAPGLRHAGRVPRPLGRRPVPARGLVGRPGHGAAAGIPDGVVHRPKWQIALEMLDRARANGVVLPWLTFDEGYGRATEFLHALDDRGQQYVAEVPTTFTGWCVRPRLLHRAHHPDDRLGRPRTFPRLAASARPASEVRDLLRCSSALTGGRGSGST